MAGPATGATNNRVIQLAWRSDAQQMTFNQRPADGLCRSPDESDPGIGGRNAMVGISSEARASATPSRMEQVSMSGRVELVCLCPFASGHG
jgi:hypothetical protein